MSHPRYPSLYQVNTRVWLTRLTVDLGRPATLDDVPDDALDHWVEQGFDWIWLLSVWQTGQAGLQVSRAHPEWRKEFQETLPDLQDDDILGSGFAIAGYKVHEALGRDAALARLRERMRKRGLKLMLDFVPNHTAIDHPWVTEHPDFYITGTEEHLQQGPQNYLRVKSKQGDLILAYGRDPYFSGWVDTLQLNYANPATQQAMREELLRIADQCDGVRCDMAMLVLPEVFQRTWGKTSPPFWQETIEQVRARQPAFCFLAEVYWDLEWTLQQLGFDYTYDKRLYDRLRDAKPRPVREHLYAELEYQNKLARFLENHDEPRAAAAFEDRQHAAAAAITFLTPGMRFFHQGEFVGRKKRISPHLVRAPEEPVNSQLEKMYDRLLAVGRLSVVREGDWELVDCGPAWDGNWTWDSFIACTWSREGDERVLVVVNYTGYQSQCIAHLPFDDITDGRWLLVDQLSADQFERSGERMRNQGLFIEASPWQAAAYLLKRSAN